MPGLPKTVLILITVISITIILGDIPMPIKNSQTTWGAASRIFHGTGVILIFVLLAHGWWMVNFAARESRVEHYSWHASLGYAFLAITLLRLVWRWSQTVPLIPSNSASWEKWAAHTAHWALYILMFTVAVSGWGLAGTFRTPLDANLFGIIRVPAIANAENPLLHGQLEEIHGDMAWLLAALILIHVVAALYHHFIRKDDVLSRMFSQRNS
jgi:cytochrome b561